MPIVQAKCENCGAALNVDSNLKAANCPHCGSAYVVQDAINYYNSVTNIEHLHADVVNISDENSATGRLKAAEAHIDVGSYQLAENEFYKVTKLTPQDYRGWWGLVRCGVVKRISGNDPSLVTLDGYVKYVQKFAPSNVNKEIMKLWSEYHSLEEAKDDRKLQIKNNSSLAESLRRQLGSLKQRYSAENYKVNATVSMKWFYILLGFMISGFIPFVVALLSGAKFFSGVGFLGYFYFPIVLFCFVVYLFIIIPRRVKNKKSIETAKKNAEAVREQISNLDYQIYSLTSLNADIESEVSTLNYESRDLIDQIIKKS